MNELSKQKKNLVQRVFKEKLRKCNDMWKKIMEIAVVIRNILDRIYVQIEEKINDVETY